MSTGKKHHRPYRLSVVMIVKNEAENLSISLPAVANWADEIVILDSGSSDESQAVAKQYGAKWHVNANWPGFGKQRQIAQSYASGDWILALDADEEVSDTLKQSILSVIDQTPGNVIYGIKRLDCIFGHQIDCPFWPVKAHWRLYPRQFQYNDNKVHESVDLKNAQTRSLKGFLHHHTAPDPHFWLSKRLEYAKTWAKERAEKGKKTNVLTIVFKTFWALIKQYVIDGRFIQGKYGFIYACLFTQYTFNKYALLYDMGRQPQTYSPDFEPHSINRHNLFNRPLPEKITGKKHSISVVMIVKDEQKHLPACLYNIYDIVDEIVILDSGSTDSTRSIAKYFNAKWHVNNDWLGFGKQRQIAQRFASGDYILMLDPDELLNETLKASILAIANTENMEKAAYSIRYANIFCGQAAHGNAWYFDQIVRFYPNRYFEYHDYEVHESLNYGSATVHNLKGYIEHFTNDNLYHFLFKNVRYSHDWAKEKYEKGGKSSSVISLPFRTFFSFFREFVIRGAFLGGAYGFFLAVSASGYNFNKYLMLFEKKSCDKNKKDK